MYQELPPMEEGGLSGLSGLPGNQGSNTSGSSTGVPRNNSTTDGIPDVARIMGASSLDILAKRTMRCGGCGSKVGAQVLTRALKRVKKWIPTNSCIITGIHSNMSVYKCVYVCMCVCVCICVISYIYI